MDYATIFGKDTDLEYMKKALICAHKGLEAGEVPIGAVLVNDQGAIISSAHNRVETLQTQTAHAEIEAITMATRNNGDWRLENYWLYVTLQPCLMCMGLIVLSRIRGVVYGANSPLFGYALDMASFSSVYKRSMPIILSGVCEAESTELLKLFFKEKREVARDHGKDGHRRNKEGSFRKKS